VPQTQVEHTAEVAKGVTETWKANEGVHVVRSFFRVSGTLVIEPCAQVRLASNATISLRETGELKVGSEGGGLVDIDALEAGKP
jgi:hypothetical protein